MYIRFYGGSGEKVSGHRPKRMRVKMSEGFDNIMVRDDTGYTLFYANYPSEPYPSDTWLEFPLDMNYSDTDSQFDIISVRIEKTGGDPQHDPRNYVSGFEISYSRSVGSAPV